MTNTLAWNLTLQSEIDFAWRLKAFDPRPRTEAHQRMGRKPLVRLAPSASRISQLSHQARHRVAGGEPLVLQFLDVSRAYPHSEVLRDDFFVETVPEMGLPEDTCVLARRGWYGMRDAGQAFEFAVRDHFLDHDFKQGMFSLFVFAHRSKFLLYFVHGDVHVGW